MLSKINHSHSVDPGNGKTYIYLSQDSLASLARRIRVCFSRQIPVRIRAHPRGAFNSVGVSPTLTLRGGGFLRLS